MNVCVCVKSQYSDQLLNARGRGLFCAVDARDVAHRDRLVAALRSQGLHAYLLTYFSPFLVVFPGRYGGKIKVKVKVHTLDIAPLRSESPTQKRSDTARVFEGFHSFTCTPTRSSDMWRHVSLDSGDGKEHKPSDNELNQYPGFAKTEPEPGNKNCENPN